jgi:glycosyltransferase involved in cell wall biosynthesis
LGLSLETPIVLSIAGNLNEERKGGAILKEILESGVKDNCQFLLIGEGNQFNDPKIKSLGYVQDEITLRIAYHAADVLLHPALVDNLPNTVAESMSCGTPVLAFHTGGIPEMVVPDKSGWLVESIQSVLMIRTLNSLLSENKFTNDMRISTQAMAKEIFNTQVIGDKYYHTLRW